MAHLGFEGWGLGSSDWGFGFRGWRSGFWRASRVE